MTDAVVSIVSEMTGYPPDLLDLDLDLEADLGVDTVKQAEVFAAVRGRFGVERDDSLSLREFPTLTHVIGWIRDKIAAKALAAPSAAAAPAASAETAQAAPAATPVAAPAAPAPATGRCQRRPRTAAPAAVAEAVPTEAEVTDAVVSIVSEMTGYPPDLLDLDLDLEADLGVDTVKQAEVFAAVRGRFGVERDDSLSLREFPTLTHVIGWIRDKIAAKSPAAPSAAAAPAASAETAPAARTCRTGSRRDRDCPYRACRGDRN